MPTLRRDAVRKLLADDPAQVVWLMPGADGKFTPEILPDDMLERPRSSRIFYNGKFYSYPLKPFEALVKLGLVESGLCALSYAKARLAPRPTPVTCPEPSPTSDWRNW